MYTAVSGVARYKIFVRRGSGKGIVSAYYYMQGVVGSNEKITMF